MCDKRAVHYEQLVRSAGGIVAGGLSFEAAERRRHAERAPEALHHGRAVMDAPGEP